MAVEAEPRSTPLDGDQSLSSALEHLVAASEGLIMQRIDLALLEGEEVLLRSLASAIMAVAGMVFAGAAWFALVACLVLLLSAGSRAPIAPLALFGAINAVAAFGFTRIAARRFWRHRLIRPRTGGAEPPSGTRQTDGLGRPEGRA